MTTPTLAITGSPSADEVTAVIVAIHRTAARPAARTARNRPGHTQQGELPRWRATHSSAQDHRGPRSWDADR
jgi:hypothetical protein